MDNQSKLKKLFLENGKQEAPKNTEPFSLHQEKFFYLEGGDSIDLFAINKNQEEVKHFITNYKEGMLFHFPSFEASQQYEIVATSASSSSIYVMDAPLFEKCLEEDPSLRDEVINALEIWIYQFSKILVQEALRKKEVFISPTTSSELNPDELLHCQSVTKQKNEFSTYWIKVLEGEISLLGNKEVNITTQSSFFPINEHIWFLSSSKAKVEAFDTQTLFENKNWKEALNQFSHFYKLQLLKAFELKKEEQRTLLEGRTSEEKKKFSSAIKRIKTLFQKVDDASLVSEQDPLLQALQVLERDLRIKFIIPNDLDKLNDFDEKIEAICLASKIQKRVLKLSDNWWKESGGSFLGFSKNDNKPLVLLNKVSTRYQKIQDQKKQKIDHKNASEISQLAYMFYIPFDESVNTTTGILKFTLKKVQKHLSITLLFSFLANFIILFIPMATKFLFNTAIPKTDPLLVLHITYSMLSVVFGYAFFYFLRSVAILKITIIASHTIDCALWDRILKLSPSFFKRFTVGNLFKRTTTTDRIRLSLTGSVIAVMVSALFSFLFIFIMFFYSATLAFISFVFAFFTLSLTIGFSFLKAKYLKKAFEIEGVLEGESLQIILGVAKLKVSGAEKSAFASWSEKFSNMCDYEMKARMVDSFSMACSITLPILSTMCIYAAFIVGIGIRNLTMPNFLAFIVAYSSFAAYFYPVNNTIIQLIEIFPMWKRLQPIIEEPIEETKNKIPITRIKGSVSFDEISFGYGEGENLLFNGLSLKVNPHEFVAIVGPSGSGKSTLLRLLLGFEKPKSGAIYVDSKDLESIDLRSFRKQIGCVLQDSGIMAGSIYTNLVCGGRFSIEEVMEALKLSEFEKDVKEMPMGLNTFIPMNGETLSGGQKQRLLLSRALVGKPSILIFDEATSALDNVTQNQVRENIEKLNVTRIVVAQRLSTIRKADTIHVVEDGKITQSGSYEELENAPGIFAEMVQKQKL